MLKIEAIPSDFITGNELERISASHTYFRSVPFWKAENFESYLKNPYCKVWIVTLYERRVAFLVILENIDEIEIQFLATHRFFKNQGLAEALLKRLEEEARGNGMSHILLEVRASNQPARALYEKMGYNKIHRRKNYYNHPKEDALLMQRNLIEKEEET